MAERRTVRIEKRAYSRNPWRLIDSSTGYELVVDHEYLDHPGLGPGELPKPGYPSKAEAVKALGRAAGTGLDLLDRVRELEAGRG